MARRFRKSSILQTGPPRYKKSLNVVQPETPRIRDRSFDSCGAECGGKFRQKDENPVNERMFYKQDRDTKPVAATELQDTSNAAKYPM
ncbi:hypothetical protein BHYA_0006g00360 [Botrytis hyacinthi]|uniref:Uncharacterized protein n=1 Tax=Botrytis hyacinthi TaxID=278943 RepID=A0A4Z1H074_9HELO|nr:hypothetical protein BHYA_0006g00360 [Botrytis hyacinthi]